MGTNLREAGACPRNLGSRCATVEREEKTKIGELEVADDRARAVELALSQIEKQFGKGSIMRLGSKEAIVPISVISTGSISFDAALGVGGVPRAG